MFIGHFAPGLIAARHPKALSLPTLFIGGQLIDWAFFTLFLAGVEHLRITPGISAMNPMDLYHMPYSHSLLGATVFALIAAGIYALWRRNIVGAIILGIVVVSHWFLDWLVHVPDMTLTGSPPKLGLGLWNHPMIEMPLEIAIILVPIALLVRAGTLAQGRAITLAAGLLLFQAINWFAPPPTVATPAQAIVALTAYAVLTGLAWWASKGAPAISLFGTHV